MKIQKYGPNITSGKSKGDVMLQGFLREFVEMETI